MDYSLPGSSVHGIFQEWIAIPFFRGSSWPCKAKANDGPSLIWTSKASELDLKAKMTDILCFYKNRSEVKWLSHIRLFATPWTVAYQAPSMGFSRQEYWSGLPFPSPGDLPNPGIEPRNPALQAEALPSEPPGKPLETLNIESWVSKMRNNTEHQALLSAE